MEGKKNYYKKTYKTAEKTPTYKSKQGYLWFMFNG